MNKIFRSILILTCIFFINMQVKAGIPEETLTAVTNSKFAFWAFLLGGLSALSLVIGAFLGITWKPSLKLTAGFTAFGAGALLAALSVELIAPTVMEFVENGKNVANAHSGHDMYFEFLFLIAGCIVGGILFYSLNEALNSKGGYLRKASTTISYFNHLRNKRFRLVLKRFSKIKLFRSIPASHMDVLIQHIRQVHIKKGKFLFRKGDKLTRIYFIESGEILASTDIDNQQLIKSNGVIGETAFLTQHPVLYDALAQTDVKVFELTENDFVHIKDSCPELQETLEKESHNELMHDLTISGVNFDISKEAVQWADSAADHIHHNTYIPTQKEINENAEKQGSAPLSIWLGIFLDGIPESFVIGAGFLLILATKGATDNLAFTDVIPYTLIAGLFLSNLPEAMSSSIGMRKMGWKFPRILALWTSLMLMTAFGAVIGYYYGAQIPNYLKIGIEGIAAGAMLTMIAQTMIPEAVHIGGNKVTGLSTLAGYLAAVSFKIFE